MPAAVIAALVLVVLAVLIVVANKADILARRKRSGCAWRGLGNGRGGRG